MGITRVRRIHLEHDAGAPVPGAAPLEGLVFEALPECPPALYRWLYAETGRAWRWTDRLSWTDAQIAEHLADPRVTIVLLRQGPLPVGWAQLQRHDERTIEIVYFGLLPWMLGRGLGSWFLETVMAAGYARGAERVILNTCTLDHPAALPNYLARGFREVRDEWYEVDDIPADGGLRS